MAMRSWWRAGRVAVGFAGGGALLLLTACTAPTPYEPARDDGFGYSVRQIEDNRYRVVFAGNAVTPRTTVQDYLLFRAAEVTLESGHDYFRVTDSNVERSTRYFGTIDSFYPGFYPPRRWVDDDDPFFHPFGRSTVTAQQIDRYTAFAEILVFEGEEPEDDPDAYDARDVITRLRPTVVRAPA